MIWLDRLLAPLARLLVARSVLHGAADQALRQALLQAARDAAAPGDTDSRLSVLTGLQRRDIARLRAASPVPADPPHPLARLVARWLADHAGADLPLRGDAGSFQALALATRQDVHPRTFLDQLMAAGTVAVEEDKVRLLTRGYVPLAGSDGALDYLSANVGDHLAGAVANVTTGAGHLDRAVHYSHLSPAAVAELTALWRSRAVAALEEVNARAAALQRESPGTLRLRVGAYDWQEKDE
jgi:hypothetical protein